MSVVVTRSARRPERDENAGCRATKSEASDAGGVAWASVERQKLAKMPTEMVYADYVPGGRKLAIKEHGFSRSSRHFPYAPSWGASFGKIIHFRRLSNIPFLAAGNVFDGARMPKRPGSTGHPTGVQFLSDTGKAPLHPVEPCVV